MGATPFASCLVKGRLDRYVYWLLNWYRGKIDGYMPDRTMSLSRTQRKFEERGRPGVFEAKGSDENLIADTDKVHGDRCIQRRLLQHRRNSQKVKNLLANQWATMQKQVHRPGGKTFHALRDARRTRFERIWADDESRKAMAEAGKDARQSISSPATTANPSAENLVSGTSPSSSEAGSLTSSS